MQIRRGEGDESTEELETGETAISRHRDIDVGLGFLALCGSGLICGVFGFASGEAVQARADAAREIAEPALTIEAPETEVQVDFEACSWTCGGLAGVSWVSIGPEGGVACHCR